jgi:hypothetical protein
MEIYLTKENQLNQKNNKKTEFFVIIFNSSNIKNTMTLSKQIECLKNQNKI